ncbi:MAG: DEAD/DEAH box helicase, partial [Deltaproteobacteria bacterium]
MGWERQRTVLSADRMTSPADRLHPALVHHIVHHYRWPRLRPVQEMALDPILDGHNTVILAPTAGGKTEAAFLPLVSRMLDEDWQGLSVLYLSPIRALLNNQEHRLREMLTLVGHQVGVWHGDIPDSEKERIRHEPPSVLLTTPESLEGMLISRRTSAAQMFAHLQAVVIDEVHAFAGSDRGWHLLAVLERLSRWTLPPADVPSPADLQRIGLSATVGNTHDIVHWLSHGSARPRTTIDPPRPDGDLPDVTLDWVATLENAARVLATLHRDEKRLVFCDSRVQAEELTVLLRRLDVETWITHSSLSTDVRSRTEQAFAEASRGVIVATSALELGIDIGDLQRVFQIDAPWTVASFLQRMGRTGRREGTRPNCTFLAITEAGLLRAAALLDAWRHHAVEPATAPTAPFHVLAQQMIAHTLECGTRTRNELLDTTLTLCEAAAIDPIDAEQLLEHLVDEQLLFEDEGVLGLGDEATAQLGRRNFLELLSVFTSPPPFTVLQGPREIGQVSASTFEPGEQVQQTLLLAGRTWRVGTIDWARRKAWVTPMETVGKVRFEGQGPGMSALLAAAHRRVLLGSSAAEEHWSRRAAPVLAGLRDEHGFLQDDGVVGTLEDRTITLWTFAGDRANRRLGHWFRLLGWERVS